MPGRDRERERERDGILCTFVKSQPRRLATRQMLTSQSSVNGRAVFGKGASDSSQTEWGLCTISSPVQKHNLRHKRKLEALVSKTYL